MIFMRRTIFLVFFSYFMYFFLLMDRLKKKLGLEPFQYQQGSCLTFKNNYILISRYYFICSKKFIQNTRIF